LFAYFWIATSYVFTVIPLMSVSVVLLITITRATAHLKIPRCCHSWHKNREHPFI